jgi:hypothetical protein
MRSHFRCSRTCGPTSEAEKASFGPGEFSKDPRVRLQPSANKISRSVKTWSSINSQVWSLRKTDLLETVPTSVHTPYSELVCVGYRFGFRASFLEIFGGFTNT